MHLKFTITLRAGQTSLHTGQDQQIHTHVWAVTIDQRCSIIICLMKMKLIRIIPISHFHPITEVTGLILI